MCQQLECIVLTDIKKKEWLRYKANVIVIKKKKADSQNSMDACVCRLIVCLTTTCQQCAPDHMPDSSLWVMINNRTYSYLFSL